MKHTKLHVISTTPVLRMYVCTSHSIPLRSDAQERITAMKEQLKSSAHSVSHLEESKHDTEMRLKEAETRRDAFRKQVRMYIRMYCT